MNAIGRTRNPAAAPAATYGSIGFAARTACAAAITGAVPASASNSGPAARRDDLETGELGRHELAVLERLGRRQGHAHDSGGRRREGRGQESDRAEHEPGHRVLERERDTEPDQTHEQHRHGHRREMAREQQPAFDGYEIGPVRVVDLLGQRLGGVEGRDEERGPRDEGERGRAMPHLSERDTRNGRREWPCGADPRQWEAAQTLHIASHHRRDGPPRSTFRCAVTAEPRPAAELFERELAAQHDDGA